MNNLISNDLSGRRDNKAINILDILQYLFKYWIWYLLSIFIFTAYFYYEYSRAPYVYSRSQTVMIKTPENTPASSRVTRSAMYYNTVNVASEILQLKSKELMRQVVAITNSDISYSEEKGLRTIELYSKSPIQISLDQKKPSSRFSLTVTPLSDNQVELSNFSEGDSEKKIVTAFNKLVATPVGKLTVLKSSNYDAFHYNKEIAVTKNAVESMANYFLGNLKITQMEDDAALLMIAIEDSSPERAEAIITKMIEVYNYTTVIDKNQIANNTSNFIKERLNIIERE